MSYEFDLPDLLEELPGHKITRVTRHYQENQTYDESNKVGGGQAETIQIEVDGKIWLDIQVPGLPSQLFEILKGEYDGKVQPAQTSQGF